MAKAENGVQDWDPDDLLILARMWQAGDIGVLAQDGKVETALENIQTRVLLMPGRTDQYFRYVILFFLFFFSQLSSPDGFLFILSTCLEDM
jgi:homoserine acetyltransferase